MFTPSHGSPLLRRPEATAWAISNIRPPDSGGRSSRREAWAFGITRVWPGLIGRMSRNASATGSSATTLAGSCLRTILQKMHSEAAATTSDELPGRFQVCGVPSGPSREIAREGGPAHRLHERLDAVHVPVPGCVHDEGSEEDDPGEEPEHSSGFEEVVSHGLQPPDCEDAHEYRPAP